MFWLQELARIRKTLLNCCECIVSNRAASDRTASEQRNGTKLGQQILAHSHYAVLQVAMTASTTEIRRSYRELSKLYHPDTTRLPASYATAKFRQLNEAYHVLSNPDSRQTYDRQLSQSALCQWASPASPPQTISPRASSAYLAPNDRPLSSGEIFALFILGLALIACLTLAIIVGILRGNTPVHSLPAYANTSPNFLHPPTISQQLQVPTPLVPHGSVVR